MPRSQHAYDKAMALLSEWNIDPFNMVASEIGESGYLTFQRDAFGKVVIEDDRLQVDVNEWPKGFPSREFIGLVEQAKGL